MSRSTERLDGANRFNRVGQVIPDRRAYFKYGFGEYNAPMPLRPVRKSSPARTKFKAARAAVRAVTVRRAA